MTFNVQGVELSDIERLTWRLSLSNLTAGFKLQASGLGQPYTVMIFTSTVISRRLLLNQLYCTSVNVEKSQAQFSYCLGYCSPTSTPYWFYFILPTRGIDSSILALR